MSERGVVESTVEEAALTWLESLDWAVKHGPDIAPDALAAERRDYAQVVLTQRPRDGRTRLNTHPPAEVVEEALRRSNHPDGAMPEAQNCAYHRIRVDTCQ